MNCDVAGISFSSHARAGFEDRDLREDIKARTRGGKQSCDFP